jgi:hypothetical protein
MRPAPLPRSAFLCSHYCIKRLNGSVGVDIFGISVLWIITNISCYREFKMKDAAARLLQIQAKGSLPCIPGAEYWEIGLLQRNTASSSRDWTTRASGMSDNSSMLQIPQTLITKLYVRAWMNAVDIIHNSMQIMQHSQEQKLSIRTIFLNRVID